MAAQHTLTAPDLIHPNGALMAAHFPGEDLAAIVGVWLTQAQTYLAGVNTDKPNDAAAQHVYRAAYGAIARRLGAMPDKATYSGPNTVTRENSGGRIAYWERKAAEADAKLSELVISDEPAAPPAHSVIVGLRPTF